MSSFYSEAKVIHRHRVHAKDGWRVRILEELLYLRSITRQPGVNDILLGTICAMAPPGGFQSAHQPHVSGVVRAVDHCVDVPAASVVWGSGEILNRQGSENLGHQMTGRLKKCKGGRFDSGSSLVERQNVKVPQDTKGQHVG